MGYRPGRAQQRRAAVQKGLAQKGGLLVSQEHSLALPKLVLLGDTILCGSALLLVSCQCQLAQKRNGLPVPVENQNVVFIHDGIITTAYRLDRYFSS